MRLKVFFIFLVLQFGAFGLWQGVQAFWPDFNQAALARTDEALRPSAFSAQLPPSLHLSAQTQANAIIPVSAAIQKTIDRLVARLPAGHTRSLRSIVLKDDPSAPRGLGGAHTILLKSRGVSPEELTSVLTHEIGHTVDLGYLNSPSPSEPSEFHDGDTPIYTGDPSLDFYRVSWVNEKELRRDATNFDFVSGYAMTDPFEDFAESYAFYVLHNRDFRFLASTNEVLFLKYTFLKNIVFAGQEFNTTETSQMSAFRRVWDVTLLPIRPN